MPNVNMTLSDAVLAALETDAKAHNLRPSDHATRIIEDHLGAQGDLLSDDVKADIKLSRDLIDQAVAAALKLSEGGNFAPSITFDAIQAVSADPEWLKGYATLVRDDPYKTGSPRKQTINQNMGYFIKKALGANSVIGSNGRPANVKVKGSIIQSYTPLTR